MLKLVIFLISTEFFLFSKIYADSDFIIKVETIKLEKYPQAYNASLVPFKQGYLLAFRNDLFKIPLSDLPNFKQYIGLAFLDSNFKPIYKPIILKTLGNRSYDPRLCWINKDLYLIYASASSNDKDSVTSSHLKLSKIDTSNYPFKPIYSRSLKVPFQNLWEKNWVLFNYDSNLLLSYQINPHVVLEPNFLNGNCKVVSENKSVFDWEFGIVRGGTPAILLDHRYLAFFHSSKKIGNSYRYFIGAYTFADRPPFEVLEISKEPFRHKDFYSAKRNGLTTSDVIFPGSFFIEGDNIKLCYGENDASIKLMTIDKKKLLDSLVKIGE